MMQLEESTAALLAQFEEEDAAFDASLAAAEHACCALRHQTRWLELLAVHRTFGHLELFERGLEASSRCTIFKVWQAR